MAQNKKKNKYIILVLGAKCIWRANVSGLCTIGSQRYFVHCTARKANKKPKHNSLISFVASFGEL